MRSSFGSFVLFCGFFWLAPANAAVRIDIDLATQTMHVESSSGSYSWAISSARAGYVTPRGTFRPYSLQTMHFSRKYYDSPMPHSIFFDGGYAIHGTYETAWLGRPASHGCVRIAPENAELLYDMVKAEGAVINISGTPPVYFATRIRYRPPMSADGGWQFDPFGR
jgi:lipoprotein-anchoring transpeptidase ErfK/SrfK